MVTLPTRHSKGELKLALRLAEALGCVELHVFWTAVDSGACRVQDPKE